MKKNIAICSLLCCCLCILNAQLNQTTENLIYKLQNANDDHLKIQILDSLALFMNTFDRGKSLDYSRQQLALAEKLGDTEGVHRAYYNLALVLEIFGKPDSALFYNERAAQYFKKQKNHLYYVRITYNKMKILNNKGLQNEAVPIALSNVAYADSIKDAQLTGQTSLYMGIMYNEIYKGEEALKWFDKAQQALVPFKEAAEKQLIGNIYLHRGNALRMLNHDKFAIDSYEKAFVIFDKADFLRGKVFTLNGLGEVYFKTKKYAQATAYFEQNIDLCKKGHFEDLLLKLYSNCAAAYIELKQYDKAEKIYEACLPLVNKMNVAEKIRVYEYLSRLKAKESDYAAALDYMEKVKQLIVQQNNSINNYQTDVLIKKHAVEKQERENANLQFQNKIYLVGLLGLFALFGIGSWVYYRLAKQKEMIDQQKDNLEILNHAKDKIFAIISHDLMSPVATLKNYMMLIDWGVMSQSEFVESSKIFKKDVNNVYNMLENVLHWSITQMKGIKPKLEKVDIAEVINEQVALLDSVAKGKNIDVALTILNSPYIEMDKNHFALIIRNLFQNALKFTNIGGKITFNHQNTEGGQVIQIIDNGIGISHEMQAQLFKVNNNTNRVGTKKEKGTGLGLILTKELVELNKGKISVESVIGKGTTFSLFFAHYPKN